MFLNEAVLYIKLSFKMASGGVITPFQPKQSFLITLVFTCFMPDRQEILKQAKKIMDEFVSALSKVNVKEKFGAERTEQVRICSKEKCDSTEFRKRIFKNAPKIKDDYFIMEKKEW
jgi:Asp-tRNA(Asn)/Glu-tRNA(Gln) amidotransferase C subunit